VSQAPQVCPDCGHTNEHWDQFCLSCGRRITSVQRHGPFSRLLSYLGGVKDYDPSGRGHLPYRMTVTRYPSRLEHAEPGHFPVAANGQRSRTTLPSDDDAGRPEAWLMTAAAEHGEASSQARVEPAFGQDRTEAMADREALDAPSPPQAPSTPEGF
jgi:hypothetical protein